MPYKSEKAIISGTKHDRRMKLTNEQRQEIRKIRQDKGYSYRVLAKIYNVSKSTIIFVCNPDRYERCREQFIERRKDGRYKVSKEKHAQVIREHRHYKQQLYLNGEI